MSEDRQLRAHLLLVALARGTVDNFTLNCAARLLELRPRRVVD